MLELPLKRLDAEVPERASGVLYKLGGAGGGLTCFMDDGYLCYEYNLFILMRTKIRTEEPLAAGRHRIEIDTVYAEVKPGGPLSITINVGGQQVAAGAVPISAPLLFSANDCLDIGIALGSWWAEMIEIPCIVMAGSEIESVAAVATTGAEFVGLSAAVFGAGADARDRVRAANELLDRVAPRFEY